jgi:hypothetical protein
MLSAILGGREARGGLKLPPLSEKSTVIDLSVFAVPGGNCSTKAILHGARQGRPCTSGIQLAELKRSSRTPDRKKSYKSDRSCRVVASPSPLIEFKGPDRLERRCETRCSTKEQENANLIPWIRQAQNIPRPESRRPNSNFNLEGSIDASSRCRDSAGGGQRRAFWKQLQQSMTATLDEAPTSSRPSSKQLHMPPDLG